MAIKTPTTRVYPAPLYTLPAPLYTVLVAMLASCCLSLTLGANTARAEGQPASFTGACKAASPGGDLSASELGGYNHLITQAPDRLQASTDPEWSDGCAIRVEVQDGDVDSSATDRAEIAGDKTLWHAGDSVWYAMSFMLASSSPLPSAGQWMVVHQFFAQNQSTGVSGGSPPLAIEVEPGDAIGVRVRGGSKSSASEEAPRDSLYRLSAAAPGSWHQLLLHVEWSAGNDGLVEAWQRTAGGYFTDTPEISAAGPNMLNVAGNVLPVYPETGIYRSRVAYPQVVYYGGLWARSNRAEAEAFFPAPSLLKSLVPRPPTQEGATQKPAQEGPIQEGPAEASTTKEDPAEEGSTRESPAKENSANENSAGGSSSQGSQGGLLPSGSPEAVSIAGDTASDSAPGVDRSGLCARLRSASQYRISQRAGTISNSVTIPVAGRYRDSLEVARVRALSHGHRHPVADLAKRRPIAIAAGVVRSDTAGLQPLTLRLTGHGRRLIRAARRRGAALRLLDLLSFKPTAGPRIECSDRLTIRP